MSEPKRSNEALKLPIIYLLGDACSELGEENKGKKSLILGNGEGSHPHGGSWRCRTQKGKGTPRSHALPEQGLQSGHVARAFQLVELGLNDLSHSDKIRLYDSTVP